MNVRIPLLALLALGVTLSLSLGVSAADDPFAAAASKVPFPVYKPSSLPQDFVLGSVEVSADSSADACLLAMFNNPNGAALMLMETAPGGLDCPECEKVQVAGGDAYFETRTESDGNCVSDLTLQLGKTAVVVGLREKQGREKTALLADLKRFAESLQKLEAIAGTPDHQRSAQTGLSEVTRQADFPVYTPVWLPAYFNLDTVSYTPAEPATDDTPAHPAQVLISYAGPDGKTIQVIVQGPGTFSLPSGSDTRTVSVKGWRGALTRDGRMLSLALDLKDAMVVMAGSVQESTLMRAAGSLKARPQSGNL